MINEKRLALLSGEEQDMYMNARKNYKKGGSRAEELRSKYTLLGDGKSQHVICESVRSEGQPQAAYRGTKYALAGILLVGETLEDFIMHRICMEPVIEKRVDLWFNGYARDWNRDRRAREEKKK